MNDNYQWLYKTQTIVISLLLLVCSCFVLADEVTNKAQEHRIEHIDFRRINNDEGNVFIKLSASTIDPKIVEQDSKIIVLNFPNTQIAEYMLGRLYIRDFATPVQFIDIAIKNNVLAITIESKGDWSYSLYQANKELVIKIKRLTAEEKKYQLDTKDTPNDKTISLSFNNIEVKAALQILADIAKLNLVPTDSVNASMTLRLKNVLWEQALDIIMRTNELAKLQEEGNTLIIGHAGEQLKIKEYRIICSSPLRLERITINHVDATDIVKLFQRTISQPAYSASSQSNQTNLTDKRSSITVDERTNTIIALNTEERLEALRRIVAELDHPVYQIQLESKIIEVNKDYLNTLKEQINNKPELLDISINNMQKQNKGKVISQTKATVINKESTTIIKTAPPPVCGDDPRDKPYETLNKLLSVDITPFIEDNQKITFNIKIKYIMSKEPTRTTDITDITTITKTANDKQFIILDDFEGFENEQATGDNKLVIFITPTIIPPKQYPLK